MLIRRVRQGSNARECLFGIQPSTNTDSFADDSIATQELLWPMADELAGHAECIFLSQFPAPCVVYEPAGLMHEVFVDLRLGARKDWAAS